MADRVLAIVDGEEIRSSDRERIVMRYPKEKQIYFQATQQGQDRLLEQMIAFKLMSRYAVSEGLDRSAEYQKKMAEIREQILTQMAMQKLFAPISVSEKEIEDLYQGNVAALGEKEGVVVRHILLDTQAQADEIREKIVRGTLTFQAAAEQFSICPSKTNGGALGTVHRGEMPPEFEAAAFSLSPCVVSEPIKTQYGYHLIEVEEKTPARNLPLEEVRESIRAQLLAQKQQMAYEEKENELRQRFGVVRPKVEPTETNCADDGEGNCT